ncbi:MAG: RhuM family protein, partial [Campylobacterales bacterium]
VNSKRATSFRIWATKILKEYLVKGYAVNQKRLEQKGLKELNETMSLLKNTISKSELELSEAKGLLDVIISYSRTWSLLQGYDEDSLKINNKPISVIWRRGAYTNHRRKSRKSALLHHQGSPL